MRALSDALDSFDRELAASAFHGYGPRPIPHALDHTLEELVGSYLATTSSERLLIKCLSQQASSVFLAFTERQASLAVRQGSPVRLAAALVAAGLAAEVTEDSREPTLFLPLPWQSAKLLRCEPEPLFEQA